jgi:hypothetical protein
MPPDKRIRGSKNEDYGDESALATFPPSTENGSRKRPPFEGEKHE